MIFFFFVGGFGDGFEWDVWFVGEFFDYFVVGGVVVFGVEVDFGWCLVDVDFVGGEVEVGCYVESEKVFMVVEEMGDEFWGWEVLVLFVG